MPYYWHPEEPRYYVAPRRYGCLNFLFDAFMFIITSGLWIIWIVVREMRRR